jgi:hypothetical protein
MLASSMLSFDCNSVSWEGVKFRGRACQRRDYTFWNFQPIAGCYSSEMLWVGSNKNNGCACQRSEKWYSVVTGWISIKIWHDFVLAVYNIVAQFHAKWINADISTELRKSKIKRAAKLFENSSFTKIWWF